VRQQFILAQLRLGADDLVVSEIGLGCQWLSQAYGPGLEKIANLGDRYQLGSDAANMDGVVFFCCLASLPVSVLSIRLR
jgi:hypothetical protein